MQGDEWIKTVIIGGGLILFGFLLLPLFFVYGYAVRTINAVLAEDPSPPTFDNWRDLLTRGLQAWLISIIYLIIPALVGGVTVGTSILATSTGREAGAILGMGGFLAGITVSAILSLVFGYLAVIGIVNFALTDRFGSAFDVGVIKTTALNREYALAWLVSVGVFVGAGVVGAIPLIGWLLTPFASFYAMIVAANLLAGGFAQAFDVTSKSDRPRDREATI